MGDHVYLVHVRCPCCSFLVNLQSDMYIFLHCYHITITLLQSYLWGNRCYMTWSLSCACIFRSKLSVWSIFQPHQKLNWWIDRKKVWVLRCSCIFDLSTFPSSLAFLIWGSANWYKQPPDTTFTLMYIPLDRGQLIDTSIVLVFFNKFGHLRCRVHHT